MKLMKKVVALTMSAVFTVSMTSTALAITNPHLKYGTEKIYGEDKTQHKPIYQDEFEYNLGKQYAILPKSDTFSFEKEGSEVEDSHNVTITWWAATVYEVDGQASLSLEGTRDLKTEKFVYGKEYSVYPDDVRDKILEQEAHTEAMGVSGYYNQYNSNLTNKNEPIMVLDIQDQDLGYEVYWIYQVVDNWKAPTTANSTYAWASNSKGWWVQKADGTYLTNAWYQSPASGLWYYMGADGYMLTNTTTPDGYKVNSDGAWVK